MTTPLRSRLALFALAAAAGLTATVSAGKSQLVASPALIEALSGVDFLPPADDLTAMVGGDLQVLVDLAESDVDPGVRIRAYRSLGLLDSDLTRSALAASVEKRKTATAGTELLILIASVEGLGQIGGADAVRALVPLLDAPARDLRAATARALGATAAPGACAPLRARQSQEASSQVRLAIDAAIAAVCP